MGLQASHYRGRGFDLWSGVRELSRYTKSGIANNNNNNNNNNNREYFSGPFPELSESH